MRFIFIVLCCLSLSSCWVNSRGEKSGIIVKAHYSGVLFRTYEVESIRGGFSNGSGVNGSSVMFTLGGRKTPLVKEVFSLVESSKPVKIIYHCELFVAPWRGQSNCFIDKIID